MPGPTIRYRDDWGISGTLSPSPEDLLGLLEDSRTQPEAGGAPSPSQIGGKLPLDPYSTPKGRPRVTHEQLQAALARIPPEEADAIELYWRLGKTETDIGTIFGVTQASIKYRLQRGRDRLRWLLVAEGSWFTALGLRGVLQGLMPPTEIEMLCVLWTTTSQRSLIPQFYSEGYLNSMGTPVGKLLRKFHKVCSKDPELAIYAKGFTALKTKWQILVSVPNQTRGMKMPSRGRPDGGRKK